MLRPRLIPVLLLKGNALVKSTRFRNYRYIGDPLHAVRLFNDLRADELLFLDIDAGTQGRVTSTNFLRSIAEEARMGFGIGGGITTLAQIKTFIAEGAEKVVVCTAAVQQPGFIKEASAQFGASAISVCIDVKRNFRGKERVVVRNGRKIVSLAPVAFAQQMESEGAGEIIVQAIERDGTMEGYNLELIRAVSMAVRIPVVALGGAGEDRHFRDGYLYGMASALAAGSKFIYQGPRRGVLINYPENTAEIFHEEWR